VVASFIDTAKIHGLPASTLTDNESVCTARFTDGHNEFELQLANLSKKVPSPPRQPAALPQPTGA
jgi:hypothetical protein